MEKIWYQSYDEGVPHTIDPDQYQSLPDFFIKQFSDLGDRCAFINYDSSLTYAELDKYSAAFAAFLQNELKLNKGDKVAVILPNLLQYPVVLYGILRAGCVVVNMNPLYTVPEMTDELNDAQAKVAIVLDKFASTLQQALPNTSVNYTVVSHFGDMMGGFKGCLFNFVVKYIKRMVPNYHIDNAISFKTALSRGAKQSLHSVEITGNDMAFLQYTGGTTGKAKGAILTHRNILANMLQTEAWLGLSGTDHPTFLAALPLYHIFSLTVSCFVGMTQGATCLLITDPRDIKSFLHILAKHPVNIFLGINTLFNGMMHHSAFKKANFTQLKVTISGGMPTQKDVSDRWRELTGHTIVQGYGLTEASPVVTVNPLSVAEFSGSIGLPIPSTDISVRDDEGKELAIAEIGELCVKGPQVMQGYWNKPEETAHVLDAEGWLRTGDMVKVDNKGFVYIVDRKKDMILVSGFNVYPTEIEDVIMGMPEVQEVAVIGVPSESTGEAVKACIVKHDPNLTEQQVLDYCHRSLTFYKVPDLIEFLDELPKSNVGKVLRRELRD